MTVLETRRGCPPRRGGQITRSTSPLRGSRLVATTGAALLLTAATLVSTSVSAQADEEYTVRAGDTLSSLAHRSGGTVDAIARANDLADPALIRIGQRLTLPSTPTGPAPTSTPTAPTHTVTPGETVSHLAARYGTTTAAISTANGLDARALIRAGQVLTIPAANEPTSAALTSPTSHTYTVRSGDTVTKIAARTDSTVADIVRLNSLDTRAFIRVGQVLTLPGAPAALVGSTFAGRTYADSVVAAANANKAALLARGTPAPADMQALVIATAQTMGVDPALAQAIAYQESGFQHDAVSPANAVGVMQVIPSSGDWASELVGRPLDLLDPTDNVVAGLAILRALLGTGGDPATAVASYYQGASSVRRHGMYDDTRQYVASIEALRTRFA